MVSAGAPQPVGLPTDSAEIVGILAAEIFQLHRHPGILLQQRLVPSEEVPVERGEGAGVGALGHLGLVAAALAGVAHPVEISAGGTVGL